MTGDDFSEDDIPAFLKDTDPNKIVDDLEDDDDFDFPSLDDEEQEELDDADQFDLDDSLTRILADEPKAEPEKPAKPAPKAKETKADKQARLKQKADEQKALNEAAAKEEAAAEQAAKASSNSGDTIAAGQLRALIERIERLEEEKKTIGDDIKEVYAEAKGTGFDTKAIRKIIALRKKDKAEREEEEAILHLYMFSLGME